MYSGQEQPPIPQPPAYSPPPQRVKFEDIGEAFQLLQKQLGAWVGAGAITFFGTLTAVVPFYVWVIASVLRKGESFNPATLLGPVLLMVLTLLVLSLVTTSGMYQMALKQLRGGRLSVGDLFGNLSKSGPVFVLLVLLGLIGGVIGGVSQALLGSVLGPFAGLLTSIPSYILGALSSLSVLLVLDQRLSPVEAIQESWRVMKSELWTALAFILVLGMASSLGALACGFGVIFTLPLYYLGMALMYRNFYPERFRAAENTEGS